MSKDAPKAGDAGMPSLAVIEMGGYHYVLPSDDALELARLLAKALRCDRNWGSDKPQFEVSDRTDQQTATVTFLGPVPSRQFCMDNDVIGFWS